ncbi:outer membrane receptor for ferric coprogen and ferric-rhodotorulic acid [Acinetobacter johnsonii]|uniref:TonB-dependent siderophore receptor n=1 Tax=Acinetobacter johnsonii TaxID=40214 RepID=UPI0016176532|nr:TonB-dependent siderophore receptor [Acinetobacter johnsonii]MBB4811051.1 outer membrane receptor for ferric coprogen and ferric-rhodotorulic acid [Acinetobacter johnsonii]
MFKRPLSTQKPLYLAMQIIFLSSTAMLSITHANTVEEEEANATSQPNAQLATITLTAQDKTAVTEKTGSYTTSSTNTATKLNLSLRETPQTVKVYTREYLDDRNIESFQDLLNNITGVSTTRTDERQSAFARGFQIDYYLVDGMPSNLTLGAGDPDLSIYDRVEVVKGANGLMTGAGNPAMGLNMIRKHANAKEFTGKVEASVGSWNSYSSSADLSAPLNSDGSLRGRVFVKHSDEKSFMDFYEKERNVAYGAIDYDISDKTSLSLAASYQELNRDGVRWGGLPAFYTDGTKTNFDRSSIVSSDWTFWDVKSTALFANLKQNLFNDIDLNVAYSYRRDDTDSFIFYTAGQVDKATNTIPIENASVYKDHKQNDESNVDVYISAPFTVAGRNQEIVVGGSWNKAELKKNSYGQTFVQGNPAKTKQNLIDLLGQDVIDFNNMNTHLVGTLEMDKTNPLNETTQTSGYISGKFHILDPLKAVAGLRVSSWEYESENGAGNRKFENELTPYAGIIFDFAKDYSWYASYTSIFKPQSRKEQSGDYLDPIEGKSYETGFKGELFDGRLNAGLAIFRIEQDNAAALLLNEKGENIKVDGLAENAYYGIDGVVSKGVELNVDGEINDNWGVSFGVANFDAEDAEGNDYNTTSSRNTADLFVKYKNEAWYAGAGVNYLSKIYTGTGATRIDRGDLYLANAMLGYKFDKNFSTQVNVNNIFDKKYYEGIGTSAMAWGAPRNATLSFNYKF